MKTDTPVLGVSCTPFGAFRGQVGARELGSAATRAALADAGLEPSEIDAAYVSYSVTGVITGQESMIGQMALEDAGIVGIPIVRVENACSSGSSALREAILSVQAGAADIVLALGLEVMSSVNTTAAIQALNGAGDLEREGVLGMTFPAHFAMMAQAHEREFGTTREQVATVAVKNHAHAMHNEKAQFQRPITVDSPNVSVVDVLVPSGRRTVSVTLSPGPCAASASPRPLRSATGVPSIFSMRSPAVIPALLAGPPG